MSSVQSLKQKITNLNKLEKYFLDQIVSVKNARQFFKRESVAKKLNVTEIPKSKSGLLTLASKLLTKISNTKINTYKQIFKLEKEIAQQSQKVKKVISKKSKKVKLNLDTLD